MTYGMNEYVLDFLYRVLALHGFHLWEPELFNLLVMEYTLVLDFQCQRIKKGHKHDIK